MEAEIKSSNNEKKFNCKYLEMYENNDGEEFFDEKFLQNQNYIFITVDSKTARKYIDNQCTQYDNEDLPEFSIPMCIKRNFTSKIEHCIEWGLDKFNEFFVLPIEDIKKFLENKEQLFSAIQNEDTSTVIINKMKKIKNLLKITTENNFDKIIKEAMDIYHELFIFRIKKLIDEFPVDHTNENGSLFWSGCKRFPNAIDFDINNMDYFFL